MYVLHFFVTPLISTSSNSVSLYFTLVGGDGGGKITASTAELISLAGFAGGSFLQDTVINPKNNTQKIDLDFFFISMIIIFFANIGEKLKFLKYFVG
jgi:hypothetical protein